jgi:hypothetical protein
MTGSSFVQAYANKSQREWEEAALRMAAEGGAVEWPLVAVTGRAKDGRSVTFRTTSDYFAVGTPEDALRLPLSAPAAQALADQKGMFLPTPLMVHLTWKTAAKVEPRPQWPNRGPNILQYAEHNRIIRDQFRSAQIAPIAGRLVSGHKKDVVIGKLVVPGKVVIFGWYSEKGIPGLAAPGDRIQPRSNVHEAMYADYSHGIRLVSPTVTVEGEEKSFVDVMADPILSSALSDEGPLRPDKLRYETGFPKAEPVAFFQGFPYFPGRGILELGVNALIFASRGGKVAV